MNLKPSRFRTLLTVSFDTGVAVALALLIGVCLVVFGYLIAGGTSGLTANPSTAWSSWQLTVDDASDPAAAALVAGLRRRLAGDPDSYHIEWEEYEGTLWLTAWFEGPSVRAAIADEIDESGLWTHQLRIGHNWGRTLGRFIDDPIGSAQSHSWVVSFVILTSSAVFLVAGAAMRRLRPSPGYESTPPPWSRTIPLGVALGAVGYAAAYLVTSLFRGLGLEAGEQNWIAELAQGNTLAVATIVVLAVVVAPMGEELFFRGHVFRYVASNDGTPLAYGSSVVLFSAAHFNPPGIPAYVVAALILGWSYDRWRCLRLPMIVHATWNALGVALLLM